MPLWKPCREPSEPRPPGSRSCTGAMGIAYGVRSLHSRVTGRLLAMLLPRRSLKRSEGEGRFGIHRGGYGEQHFVSLLGTSVNEDVALLMRSLKATKWTPLKERIWSCLSASFRRS